MTDHALYISLGLIGLYLIVRWATRPKANQVEVEIAEILRDDKYKVKGRYD